MKHSAIFGRILFVALPLLLAGCIAGSDRVTGTTAYTTTGGTNQGGAIDPALVGRWSRITLFDDNSGFLHTSQLIWEFNSDGGARRIIITTNLDLGLQSTEVSPAIWRASGGGVEITFLTSGGGTLRYQYSVLQTLLSLGPFVLERLP